MDLYAEQHQLETEMAQQGIARYNNNVLRAAEAGRMDETGAGRQLVSHNIDRLTKAIIEWRNEANTGKAGRRQTALKLTDGIDAQVLAIITLRQMVATVMQRPKLASVCVDVGTRVEDERRVQQFAEADMATYRALKKAADERHDYHYKRAIFVRAATERDMERWSNHDRMTVGQKLVALMIETTGLFSVDTFGVDGKPTTVLHPSNELNDWLRDYHGRAEVLSPVYAPMVVEPLEWTSGIGGGYLTNSVPPIRLVKGMPASALKALDMDSMSVLVDAINAMQRTAWTVNRRILEVIDAFWESGDGEAGLPSKTSRLLPVKPGDIDTNEEARKEWRKAAALVYRMQTQARSKRAQFLIGMTSAHKYKDYERIYFPYQVDFRGRAYAVPALNPQGPDWMKALLMFAEGKPLGAEGWKWLAIQGANTFGVDKVSLEDRVRWVQDHEEHILQCAEDPYSYRWWTEAGDPWQFLAFCFEWAGFIAQGESFVSHLPVALDGSCNGLQHLSACLRDELGGSAVNLTPSEKPADIYQKVADVVTEALRRDIEDGTDDITEDDGYIRAGTRTLARQWLAFGVTRKVCKRPVMTFPYGSGEYGFRDQLMTDILLPAYEAAQEGGPEFPFDRSGWQAAGYMAKLIAQAVEQTVVKAAEMMRWLKGTASVVAGGGSLVTWVSPSGLPVTQRYYEAKEGRVRITIGGQTYRIRSYSPTDSVDRNAQKNGIAPNWTHSLDSSHMMLTVCRAADQGITSFALIHDSYGTHAADTPFLFTVIREAFLEMYQSLDVAGDIVAQLMEMVPPEKREDIPPPPEFGNLDLVEVLESRYFFA